MNNIFSKMIIVALGLGFLGLGGYGLSQGKRPVKAVSMIVIGGGIALKGFRLSNSEVDVEKSEM